MMFISLLPVVLLLSVSCSASMTFKDTDPSSGRQVECDRCPPGTYLRSSCTVTHKSDCAPCPPGSFTELWNHIGRCLRCGVCGLNQVVKTACSANSDCQCECKQGYYFKYDMCHRHSECPSGEGVQTRGTANEDTVCQVCPNGTYSNIVSAQQSCMQHRSCEDAGLQLVMKGSRWHDSVCTSCEELISRDQQFIKKDGAEYLREILPAFFIHQRLAIKRLRQIVQKLLSENNKKQDGAVSGLNIPDLYARINTWVTSATVKQLRSLPTVLSNTGAHSAGEKLQNKLQRIDIHLRGLCENEVVVLTSV